MVLEGHATGSQRPTSTATLSPGGVARFALPSLAGILFFLTPMAIDGRVNIGIGFASSAAISALSSYLPAIVTTALCVSAVASLLMTSLWRSRLRLNAEDANTEAGELAAIFTVGWPTAIIRLVGATFAVMVVTQLGPTWIVSEETGGVILHDLMQVIFVMFFFAALALPLLTDFGLMELVGTLARPVFRRLFRLPGRASIDAVASWLGSATVGVLITITQYESGFYTAREAAVIATSFSVVSLAFAVVIINFVGLGGLFIPFYATVVVGGMLAAIVLPRIPPLSRKADTYRHGEGRKAERKPESAGVLSWGLQLAVSRAHRAPPPASFLRRSTLHLFDIWFGLQPLVMVIGTISLATAHYTPVFRWLSFPFVPFLELLRLPESVAAAPTMLVGFADQFLPVILGQAIDSEVTRFVVACTAVTQLIYMSEVGALLLRSRLPLNLVDLFVIFLLRTAITVPVSAVAAHLLF